MADPYVRVVGTVLDMDDKPVRVGVDHDAVTICADGACFTAVEAEEFAQAFLSACWEAGRNAERMRQEATMPP